MGRQTKCLLALAVLVFGLISLTTLTLSARDQPVPEQPPPDEQMQATVRLADIFQAIRNDIQGSIRSFDGSAARKDFAIDLDVDDDRPMEQYREHLQAVYERFFDPVSKAYSLESTLPYLSLALRDSMPVNKVVHSTDLGKRSRGDSLSVWEKVNPKWTIDFVSASQLDTWLDELFETARLGQCGLVKEMKALKGKYGIVRADLFRYLVLLVTGGIYTDTDTTSVRPISEWGRHPDMRQIHPLLSVLPDLLAISGADYDASQGRVSDDEPSMIVSIEVDGTTGRDWRSDTFVRGIQIAQWTLSAKKGHPILLDVLGRALHEARQVREDVERGLEVPEPDVLEWSGPGAFSDAVFRYLLVIYGVHPTDLAGLTRPTRFGDILVMPDLSFRADASEGYQGEHRVVWHGFLGRWKEEAKVVSS